MLKYSVNQLINLVEKLAHPIIFHNIERIVDKKKAVLLLLCFVFNVPLRTLDLALSTYIAFDFPTFKFWNPNNWTSSINSQCVIDTILCGWKKKS